MRRAILSLPLALLAAPAAAQERLPILDMHLHALAADAQGPPPLAMCTPIEPFPAWDPAGPYFRTEIDRREWGLKWNQVLETGGVLVANTVKIEGEVQFVRQDAST